jgi:nicotinate phosphoribosyltransferase
MLHDSEESAFASQAKSLGAGTTLLIDTYDTEAGAAKAVAAAGPGLGAVRIDSGNLPEQAHRVRRILDDLGAAGTRIVATGDLDEFTLQEYRSAPIDSFGVGTRLVTGSGAPTAELVYKMVARARNADPQAPLDAVSKRSPSKATIGGRKTAFRRLHDGVARAEVLLASGDGETAVDLPAHRPLLVPLVVGGLPVGQQADLAAARERHRRSCAELPRRALQIEPGEPALPTEHR